MEIKKVFPETTRLAYPQNRRELFDRLGAQRYQSHEWGPMSPCEWNGGWACALPLQLKSVGLTEIYLVNGEKFCSWENPLKHYTVPIPISGFPVQYRPGPPEQEMLFVNALHSDQEMRILDRRSQFINSEYYNWVHENSFSSADNPFNYTIVCQSAGSYYDFQITGFIMPIISLQYPERTDELN